MLSCLRKEQASMGHAMLDCLAAGKTCQTSGESLGNEDCCLEFAALWLGGELGNL